MSSDRKSAANRRNARKSRGPRTWAGKMRASRNAFRHGLAAISHDNPVYCAEIEQAAKAICEGDSEPLLFEQALIIAENDLILCHVRTQRIFVIERLRDATAIALAKGDDLIVRAKARLRLNDRAVAALEPIKIELDRRSGKKQSKRSRKRGIWELLDEALHQERMSPDQSDKIGSNANGHWHATEWPDLSWPPSEERDELDAMCEAIPDLKRLARYERRAWSRRRRAVRDFLEIKSRNGDAAGNEGGSSRLLVRSHA